MIQPIRGSQKYGKFKYLSKTSSHSYFAVVNIKNLIFKAWCELPEGITKIGKSHEIEINQTISPDRFTYDIEYAPPLMEQIKALIDSSAECFQELVFQCYSTPFIEPVRIENIY